MNSDFDNRLQDDATCSGEPLVNGYSRKEWLRLVGGTGLGVALAASPLGLLGCGDSDGGPAASSETGSGKPIKGGNLVFARESDVTSFDPVTFADYSIAVSQLINETLVKASVDGRSFEPMLAESWAVGDGGRKYTFALRKGVRFTNGQPLTAADVVWSLKRANVSDTPMSFLNYEGMTFTAEGDDKVVVATDRPYGPLLSVLTLFSNAILPKNFAGMTEKQFASTPIGTGPFKLAEWKRGRYVRLEKNPSYWVAGKPYLDSVTFTAVPDDSTRQNQLRGGQIQIDENPSYSSLDALEATPGVNVELFPSSRTDWITINNLRRPFEDVHIRRAINFAIDKAAIVKAVNFGHGTPANSYITSALWGHDASLKGLEYNLDEAKKEMGQSSRPDGFDTTLLITSGASNQASMAQIVQQALGEIKIRVKIQALDPSAHDEALGNSNFDLAFVFFTTDMPDPSQMGRRADARPEVSNASFSHWTDPRIGPMLDKAKFSADRHVREYWYARAQALVNEEAPFVTLFYSPAPYALSDKVHGFRSALTGNYTLADTWLSN
jgi:peptide/nickel transport system substrate-binding protein